MIDITNITDLVVNSIVMVLGFIKNIIESMVPETFIEWVYIGISVFIAYLLSKAKFVITAGISFIIFMSILIFVILKLV